MDDMFDFDTRWFSAVYFYDCVTYYYACHVTYFLCLLIMLI